MWQIVHWSPAEALGAVANQKEIAKAIVSMMPVAVESELDRLKISRSFFILIGPELRVSIKSEVGNQVPISKIAAKLKI